MAFIKPAVKLILRESAHYAYAGPVLALGVPEVYATVQELNEWLPRWTGKAGDLVNSPEMLSGSPFGRRQGWVSARTFFRALGLDPVVCMDIPGSEYAPDFVHDLNRPLPDDHRDRYGLVMDPGTIEHVFDMRTCLSNVVASLQVGGVVIHQVPVYMFNGGYYSLNPNLLNDFYRKNGFVDLRTYIIMWDRYRPFVGQHRCYLYTDELMGERHALSDFDQCRFSPLMLFFARKEKAMPDTVIPIQFDGKYFTRASANIPQPKAVTLFQRARALLRPVARLVPEAWADPLRSRLSRWETLVRTRRDSFWM
jgi:hypothetical protein